VIVLDVNILLYAYDATAPLHDRARTWLEGVFSGDEPIGLPWQTVGAFLRIATNLNLPGPHATPQEAGAVVDRWLEHPLVMLLTPGDHHWPLLREMMIEGQARGPLVTDAQLAALAIENGGVLYSSDRDFARFPRLRWVNPLS
jgi:toxin-antitoxin system PIN domain toxin